VGGAEIDVAARLRSVAGNRETLVAGRDQLDRMVEPSRGDTVLYAGSASRASQRRRPNEGRDYADPLGIDAELLGQTVLDPGHIPAALPYGQLAVGPSAARREQLDRIVALSRRRAVLVDRHRGTGECGGGIADRRILVLC